MSQTQKDAVFLAVTVVLARSGINWKPGTPASRKLTDEASEAVVVRLTRGLKSGTIDLQTDIPEEEIRGYATRLLANWLKRDPRLSGESVSRKSAA